MGLKQALSHVNNPRNSGTVKEATIGNSAFVVFAITVESWHVNGKQAWEKIYGLRHAIGYNAQLTHSTFLCIFFEARSVWESGRRICQSTANRFKTHRWIAVWRLNFSEEFRCCKCL